MSKIDNDPIRRLNPEYGRGSDPKFKLMDVRMRQQPSPDSIPSGGEISPLYYQEGNCQYLTYEKTANSLQLWKKEVNSRNKLQDYVAGKTRRRLPDLLMNSTNPGYDRMLHNEVIDQILPLVSNGKTARLKSEFWFQPEVVGRFYDEGIRFSRTKRDQGILPPLEYIGRPNPKSLRDEPQKRDSGTSDGQGFIEKHLRRRHPWHILSPLERKIHRITAYKEERLAGLRPLIDELVPPKPALEELLIVGRNTDVQNDRQESRKENSSLESQMGTEYTLERGKTYIFTTTSTSQKETEADSEDTSLPMMFSGSALKVNDDQFFCLSENTSETSPRIVEIEIAFEVADERPCHKSLALYNNGSLVIYYEWKLIPKSNAFEHPQDGEQRFFFNTSNGIIRPGEERVVPLSFQSCREGVFGETWAFWTKPCLTGQHPIMVRFFGSAIWSESHADNVWELESPIELMEKRATYRMMQRIIDEILKDVESTKPTDSTPIVEQTEEDIFKAHNPLLYYAADGVEKLRKLVGDISSKKSPDADGMLLPEAETQWDLSVSSIKQEILDAHRTGLFPTPVFTDFLRRFYIIVDGLTKQPVIYEEPLATERYRIAYHRITDCLMKSFDHCSNVMMSVNMGENAQEPSVGINDKWRCAVTKLKATPEFQERLQTRGRDSNALGKTASTIDDQKNQEQQKAPGKVTMNPAWREKSEVLVREELRKTIMEIVGIWFEME